MAPIHVRFSPGFPPGEGFPGEEFAPACFYNSGGAPLQGEFSAEAAPAGSQSGEECSSVLLAPRWSNLFREKPVFPPRGQLWWDCSPGKSCSWRNPGLKRTRIGAIFKKFFMTMILKSKINLFQKTLNFVSIQWSYLQPLLNLVRLSLESPLHSCLGDVLLRTRFFTGDVSFRRCFVNGTLCV
jgi:hypothetical protein